MRGRKAHTVGYPKAIPIATTKAATVKGPAAPGRPTLLLSAIAKMPPRSRAVPTVSVQIALMILTFACGLFA